MMNTSDSDPNFNIPFAPPTVILPSYYQNPRNKRTKLTNNETGEASSSSKPKPEPNASNITRPCTECGKQFSSFKALSGHMRCHPERPWRGINPPRTYKRETTTTTATLSSSLVPVTSQTEYDVASILLTLVDFWSTGSSAGVVEGRFECGGCKKVFGSHQALGGHRATHKHVKECFAITNVTEDPAPPREIVDQYNKGKSVKLVSGTTHRCNICFKVYSSGQALGGHMRYHWEKDQEENQDSTGIDLNVPAREVQNFSGSSSDTLSECSLDLRLWL